MSHAQTTVPLAIPAPIGGYFLAQFALFAIYGGEGMMMMIREGGLSAIVVLLLAFCSAGGAGAAVGLGAPRAISILIAAMSWIVGGLFAMRTMKIVVSAVATVSPADKPILLAAGTSETLSLTVLGAGLSAGILLSTAVAFVLRAGQSDQRGKELLGAAISLLVGGAALAEAMRASSMRTVLAAVSSIRPEVRADVSAAADNGDLAWIGWSICALGAVAAVALVLTRFREAAPFSALPAMLALAALLPTTLLHREAESFAPTLSAQLEHAFPGVVPLSVTGGDIADDLPQFALLRGSTKKAAAGDVVFAEERWRGTPSFLIDGRATSEDLVRLAEELAKTDVSSLQIVATSATPPPKRGEPLVDAVLEREALRSIDLDLCRPDEQAPLVFALANGSSWQVEEKEGVHIVRAAVGAPLSPDAKALFDRFPTDVRCIAATIVTPAELWATAAALRSLGDQRVALSGTWPVVQHNNSSLAALFGGSDESHLGTGRRPQTGNPLVLGSLDKEIISRFVKQHLAQVQYCYEKELARRPDLEGSITFKWVINGEGRVTQAQVSESAMKNRNVEDCIAKRIKTWMFPNPKGGGIVIVTYPFTFKSVK